MGAITDFLGKIELVGIRYGLHSWWAFPEIYCLWFEYISANKFFRFQYLGTFCWTKNKTIIHYRRLRITFTAT
jgi:hypothetical protein